MGNQILDDFRDTVRQDREFSALDPMPDAGHAMAETALQWLDLGLAFDYEVPARETHLAYAVLERIVRVYGPLEE